MQLKPILLDVYPMYSPINTLNRTIIRQIPRLDPIRTNNCLFTYASIFLINK